MEWALLITGSVATTMLAIFGSLWLLWNYYRRQGYYDQDAQVRRPAFTIALWGLKLSIALVLFTAFSVSLSIAELLQLGSEWASRVIVGGTLIGVLGLVFGWGKLHRLEALIREAATRSRLTARR